MFLQLRLASMIKAKAENERKWFQLPISNSPNPVSHISVKSSVARAGFKVLLGLEVGDLSTPSPRVKCTAGSLGRFKLHLVGCRTDSHFSSGGTFGGISL